MQQEDQMSMRTHTHREYGLTLDRVQSHGVLIPHLATWTVAHRAVSAPTEASFIREIIRD